MRYAFLILTAVLLMGCPKGGDLPSPVPPAPGYVPEEELQIQLAEVVPISEPELAIFYLDYAELLERDSEIINTTSMFRQVNTTAGKLAFQKTDIQGKYPGLGQKLDQTALAYLGKADGPLDRERAIKLLKAYHWALQ